MTRIVLYPYPRLDRSSAAWKGWSATLSDQSHPLEEVADNWDSNADLAFRVSVRVTPAALEAISLEVDEVRLVATVACRDTAYTATAEASLVSDGTGLGAEAVVRVLSRNVSESLELRSCLIGTRADSGSLARRILADGPESRVILNSSLDGFPTVAYSFDEQGQPAAPWRLVVEADDAEAPFAHSVRLELNQDNERTRALMRGNHDALTQSALIASITRVLIGTVARMTGDSADRRSFETITAKAPDSITAAAARAASQYLGMSLERAVLDYRMRPERFDYALAVGVGPLGGRR